MTTTLILPGLSNSGPEHWQSLWERLDATCVRLQQAEWESPACSDWVATLDDAVKNLESNAVLVAHSSSCALVSHWVRVAPKEHLARIVGALLVAPSDPDGPSYPVGPTGFSPVPLERLPFPSIVVASEDDVYVTMSTARRYADEWGSELVSIGRAGHINSASGLGAWPAGYALLERLRSSSPSGALTTETTDGVAAHVEHEPPHA
ncbi:MAG: alpha/beta hydrolase [bacterium]